MQIDLTTKPSESPSLNAGARLALPSGSPMFDVGPARPTLLLCLLLAVTLAACADKATQQTAEPAAARVRPAFEAADLSAVDAAVREQIETARRKVEESQAQGGEVAAEAWLRLGQLYHAYDLLEPAAAAYENARFDAPQDVRLWHALALVRQRQGQLDEAAALFRQELEKAPSAAAAYRLGQTLVAANQPAEARAALEQARSLDAGCVAAGYELGLLALQEGRLDEAVAQLERVLAEQPSAVQAHFPLGQALQRLGRADAAKIHLAASAAREISVGGKATCDDAFEAELRPLTTGAAAYITRGQIARFAGRLDQAIEEYRQAVAIAPQDPIAHQALGKALAAKGDVAGALAEYRRATELDPAAAELKVDLGLLLEQKGEQEEAKRLFRAALEKNPELAAAHFALARLALAEGKAAPALESLDQTLRLEPGNAPARGLRAQLLMELRRPAEALEDVRQLLDESPPADAFEHASLAWAAAALGDKERAFEHLQRVASQEGADPKAKAAANYRLASLYLELGDKASAKNALESALALDPGLTPARNLLRRIEEPEG